MIDAGCDGQDPPEAVQKDAAVGVDDDKSVAECPRKVSFDGWGAFFIAPGSQRFAFRVS